MPARRALVTALLAACALAGCAHGGRLSTKARAAYATGEVRRAAIGRAQVWTATDVAAMDILAGPQGPGSFAPNAVITCDYVKKKMSGRSPKFACAIPPDDELKVKFGKHNGEVYAEVAASRLFWALGFGAEREYPVRVVCRGCPKKYDTEVAEIERKMPGREIETSDGSGWAWPELSLVDPAAGGAPRAHRDALTLLAVLIQHTDSKPEQQRLICLDKHAGKNGEPCASPFMMVHDLGQTFGHANLFNRSSVSSVNLRQWARAPVWKDADDCVASLPKSLSGSLDNPRITEEGRRFLADLLVQLTDTQLRRLFEVARFTQRWDAAPDRADTATIDGWVAAFKRKRDEIVQRTCAP